MARRRTGSLEMRKGVWHARITVDLAEGGSKREWYSLGTADKATAKRKLKRLLADLYGSGDAVLAAPKAAASESVAEYAEGYFERRESRGVVMVRDERATFRKWIAPCIGGMCVGDVRPGHVREVIEHGMTELSKESIRKLRALMLRIFQEAWRDEVISENPVSRTVVPHMRATRKHRVILTDAEIATFLAHPEVDVEIKLASLVARSIGGMRLSDVIRWDWSMIDREHFATCYVPRSKIDEPQLLEIPPALRSTLRARWEAVKKPSDGPVFPVERGPRKGQFRSTRGVSFAERLRRELAKAGVLRHELHNETASTLPVDFHSFRRAFSTALAKAGVNVQTAMQLASHSDAKVHMRYVMDSEEMRRAPDEAILSFDPTTFAPKGFAIGKGRTNLRKRGNVADAIGFEPMTFGSGGRPVDANSPQNEQHCESSAPTETHGDSPGIAPCPVESPQTPPPEFAPLNVRAGIVADLSRRMTEAASSGDLEAARVCHRAIADLLGEDTKDVGLADVVPFRSPKTK